MSNKNNWRRTPQNECGCGCGRMVAKQYARGHWRREPVSVRLDRRLDKSGDCWIWTGAIANSGYGRIGVEGNATDQVHRVAYRIAKGQIPDGLHIDHLCSVRLCCNPDHLEAVTQAENNRRAVQRSALLEGERPKPAL